MFDTTSYLLGKNAGGGGGGTSDYSQLTNKPSINGVVLSGNKTSEDLGIIIPDVSDFVTNATDDLINYYKKSETYTQTEVNSLINAITTMDVRVVQTLPTEDISTTTIYLTPKTASETNNAYDEYIYVSNNWEKIGDTEIDLDRYATKVLNSTNGDLATLDSTGNITDSGKNPYDFAFSNPYDIQINHCTLTEVSPITNNGVTYTINSDGTITANGQTGSSRSILTVNSEDGTTPSLNINLQAGVRYTISGCPAGGSNNSWFVIVGDGVGASTREYGSSASFTASSNPYIVQIIISTNTTVDNLVFRPMIKRADVYANDSSFVPYIPSNKELYQKLLSKNQELNAKIENIMQQLQS